MSRLSSDGLIVAVSLLSISACPAFAQGATKKTPTMEPAIKFSDAERKIIQEDMKKAKEVLYGKHYVHGMADFSKSKMESLYESARPLVKQGKIKEAIDALTKAIAAFQTPEERALYKTDEMLRFKQSRNYSTRGACYLAMKNYDAAVKDLTDAIVLCPDYSSPYSNRAKAYKALKKDRAAFNDIAEASNLETLPKFLLADSKGITTASDSIFQAKLEQFRKQSANKYYVNGAAGKASSKVENLYQEGRELRDAEKYEEAAAKFTAAIKAVEDPKEKAKYKSKEMIDYKLSESYKNRAFCALILKRWDQAVTDLTASIKLEPNCQENYINRGKALQALGRTKEAQADFAKAKLLKPNVLPNMQ